MIERFYRDEIGKALKTTGPSLMLDYLDIDAENGKAAGVKFSSYGEIHFTGHFPGQPVLPGVLQVAGMVQASQMLYCKMFPQDGVAVLLGVRRVKFRNPVVPGMALKIECTLQAQLEDGRVEFTVKNLCEDGAVASSGTIVLGRRDNWYGDFDTTGSNPAQESVSDLSKFIPMDEVLKYLPHRFPFLFVDRVYAWDDMSNLIGCKNVTGTETYVASTAMSEFAGYFHIEAAAQVGCAALLHCPEHQGKLGFFMSIDEAVFHRPVRAGMRLWEKINCEQRGSLGIASAQIFVGSTLVTEGQIKFAIVDRAH